MSTGSVLSRGEPAFKSCFKVEIDLVLYLKTREAWTLSSLKKWLRLKTPFIGTSLFKCSTVSTTLPCIQTLLIVLIRNCNSGKSYCPNKELSSIPSSPVNHSHPKPLLIKASTTHKMKGIQPHLWLFTEHWQTP